MFKWTLLAASVFPLAILTNWLFGINAVLIFLAAAFGVALVAGAVNGARKGWKEGRQRAQG